jgi:hypothetical protein
MYRKVVLFNIFFIFALLGLLFPLQVYTNLKYSPILIIPFVLYFFFHFLYIESNFSLSLKLFDTLFIFFYLFFFISHEFLNFYKNHISTYELFRLIYLYLFPLTFYLIGRVLIQDEEFLKMSLFGILFSSMFGLIFMVYDNILKLVFENLTRYSELASTFTEKVNRSYLSNPYFSDSSGRASPRQRSLGLLESAQVSATFISFGMIIVFSNYFMGTSKNLKK